jgi:hypothetical protein
VGLSDIGAFLTQLPFKENAVQERIVRAVSVPAGTGGAAGAWDSSIRRRTPVQPSKTSMRKLIRPVTAAVRVMLEMLFFAAKSKSGN